MRLKALVPITYFGQTWQPGMLFDALKWDALDMINKDQADPFNLEDPSTRTLSSILDDNFPAAPPVNLSPSSAAVGATAGTGTFDVTMAGPGLSRTWTVDKDAAAWLTVDSPTTPQSADGTVTYSYQDNLGVERSANLYVNNQTFTVTQDAAA